VIDYRWSQPGSRLDLSDWERTMTAETPVLDTLTDLTETSGEHNSLPPREFMLARIAALIAVDAPPASYLANAGLATDMGVTAEDIQGVMIAVAPVVGTARVVSAGGNILRALGFAIAVADADGARPPARALCHYAVAIRVIAGQETAAARCRRPTCVLVRCPLDDPSPG
jgi:hypothetical protein